MRMWNVSPKLMSRKHLFGVEPTYSIPKEAADAWMVKELRSGIIGSVSGKVICCDLMNKPEVLERIMFR